MKLKFSLQGRLAFVVSVTLVVGLLVIYLCSRWIAEPLVAYVLASLLSFSLSIWLVKRLSQSLTVRLNALHNGMLNLIDNDFSVSLANNASDELGELITLYNQLTENLRSERQYLYQRELLLDTVIQNSSLCLVLTDHSGRVIYANHYAKNMFNNGRPIQGLLFESVLDRSPHVLRDSIRLGKDGLFSIGSEGEEDSYHLSLGRFTLNTQQHNLYLIKQMTRELNRQEAATWKKVIRIISHELNNSLAPISSMAHSGSLMLEKNKAGSLPEVFETIAERAEHLKAFIDSYARLAKLPLPEKTLVNWKRLVEKLNVGYRFRVVGELPDIPGFCDQAQLEQALVNLLKNAAESGSSDDDITLSISQNSVKSVIEIADRGAGMSKRVMESALLPFYTTKASGSGVGLPLCREIIEAHDGEISLFNRENGGLRVRISLPARQEPDGLV